MSTTTAEPAKQDNDNSVQLRAQISKLEAELMAREAELKSKEEAIAGRSSDAFSRLQAEAELAYRDAQADFDRKNLELELELAHREAELELQRKQAEVDFLRKRANIEAEHRKSRSELERRHFDSKIAHERAIHRSSAHRQQPSGRFSSADTFTDTTITAGVFDRPQIGSVVSSVASAYADQLKLTADAVGSFADAVVRSSTPSRPPRRFSDRVDQSTSLIDVVNQVMEIPRRVLQQLTDVTAAR
jgi:multidrug efflux pump subunit AcrA (membrane-fusion protein)